MKTTRKIASELKNSIQTHYKAPGSIAKATIKDLTTLIECTKRGDFTAAHATNLYNKHSGEYCAACYYLNQSH